MIMRLACLVLLAFCAVGWAKTTYEGHKVVTIEKADVSVVDDLEAAGLDVWATLPSEDGSSLSIDVMLPPFTEEILHKMNLNFTTMIEDVQMRIDEEERTIKKGVQASWYDVYHNYTDIVTRLRDLATSFPAICTFIPSIGKSVENRDIPALVINTKAPTIDKHFLFQSGQHAREWIAPATTLYITELLVSRYGTDDRVKRILDRMTIDVVPMVNPDGYSFSWTNTRLWRKNRRNNGGSFGVDLNRNWDDHWCQRGASTSPSSDTYCGPSPFSEPETRAASSYVLNRGFRFDGAIDFHAYGQLILRPPGYTNTPTPDEAVLKSVGSQMQAAIRSNGGRSYTNDMAWQLYYTTGSADDWWYNAASKVKYVYCIELRDTGSSGFNLPPAQIIPTGEENYAAVSVLLNHIIAQGQ